MVIISGWFMVLGLPHCMSFTIRETGFANKVWRLWDRYGWMRQYDPNRSILTYFNGEHNDAQCPARKKKQGTPSDSHVSFFGESMPREDWSARWRVDGHHDPTLHQGSKVWEEGSGVNLWRESGRQNINTFILHLWIHNILTNAGEKHI